MSSAPASSSTYPAMRLTSFVASAADLPALRLTSLPTEAMLTVPLQADEVVIQVQYASINPSDVKNALGSMTSTVLPRVLGRDFCGVVVRAGSSAAAQAKLNATVFGSGGDLGFTVDGSHAQYLRLPVSAVAVKPASLSASQASSIGVAFVTAAHGLKRGDLRADDLVLVTGANGAVGSAVVQIAKLSGAKVIAVMRAKGNDKATDTPDAAAAAPDATVYLDQIGGFPGLAAAVRSLPLVSGRYGGVADSSDQHHRRGPSLIFDVLGGDAVTPHLLSTLETRGRLVCIAMPLPHNGVPINGLELYRQELQIIGVNSLLLDASESATLLRELLPAFESGKLNARSDAATLIAPDNAGQAYADVIGGKARGKLILHFTRA